MHQTNTRRLAMKFESKPQKREKKEMHQGQQEEYVQFMWKNDRPNPGSRDEGASVGENMAMRLAIKLLLGS
jgi:hypothetical protein